MAKVSGIVQLEGTLMGITFYKRKGVWVARKAGGGFNGKAIKTKASMVRVRENGSEFGNCMKSVQLFKKALQPLLALIRDTDRHARIVSLFTKIKNADVVSLRGSRSVGVGLQQEAGRSLLLHYVLTTGKDLTTFLPMSFSFDWDSGVCFPGVKGKELFFPKGASLMELQLIYTQIDFEHQQFTVSTSSLGVLDKNYEGDFVLPKPSFNAATTGVTIAVVALRYLQDINGTLHPFLEQQHSVIEVVGVL